jgi:ABC-type transport system involved in multi-copper enzyme maturation permease subunit
MRRWFAIAKATALEILSEPLSLLLLLSALALSVLAPALHYHQFGEPTRMARESALSALFTFGTIFVVAGMFRTMRRELESGTAQMAISHSVSRCVFLIAKFSGAMMAYAFFALILFSISLVMVYGAAVGGAISRQSGDIARLWGPALAAGVGAVVSPLILAALLNRFFRFRFVIWTFLLTLVLSTVAAASFFDLRLMLKLLPAWSVLVFPAAFLVAACAAFTLGLKPSAAIVLLVVVFAASAAVVGNYYLADTLARGSSVSWGYVLSAGAAALPAIAALLLLGVHLFERCDIV